MKRGIPIALQAAGVLLACLATSLNHPVHALAAAASMYDTAYYYNEQGEALFCNANGSGSYVIKTCKGKKEIYYDWGNVRAAINAGRFERVSIRSISFRKAKKVEALICNGQVNDAFVKRNLIQFIGRKTLSEMWMKIQDSGKNADSTTDCKEYGGVINYDTTLTLETGKSIDPCKGGVSVEIHGLGLAYYHSHPSGEKENGKCYFIQGPSKQDLDEIKKPVEIEDEIRTGINKTGYVFGMNKRSHLIYIYDKNGVQATLPFCFLLCDAINK